MDHNIKRRFGVQQMLCERLDCGNIAQVQAIQMQAVDPVRAVGLGVEPAGRGVGGKRVVTSTFAPSRSRRRTVWKPILTRPPVPAPSGQSDRHAGRASVIVSRALRAKQVVKEVDIR